MPKREESKPDKMLTGKFFNPNVEHGVNFYLDPRVKDADRNRIAEQTKAFLKAGGRIQQIKPGETGFNPLSFGRKYGQNAI